MQGRGRQGGDQGAFKVFGFLIGNVIEVLEVLGCLKVRQNGKPPERTSTSEAPAWTQAAIKKLVADSVSAALEAQAANMENTDNTTGPQETPVARKCIYKEFMSGQPFYFNGTEGAVGLIHWFE
nr:reverse transcriptase domain-containing protein [Tanacetum cinerariifolium]